MAPCVSPASSVLKEFFPLESPLYASRAAMPKKTKKPFRAVTAVKELARERVGPPPAEKIVIEKKKKPQKHKPTLGKLLGETE